MLLLPYVVKNDLKWTGSQELQIVDDRPNAVSKNYDLIWWSTDDDDDDDDDAVLNVRSKAGGSV